MANKNRQAPAPALPAYAPRAQCVIQVLVQAEAPDATFSAAAAAYSRSRNLRRLESHLWDEVA